MLTAVGSALTEIISMIGEVISAITGSSGDLNALLPLFCLGIAVSVIFASFRIIRGLTWGA